MSTPEWEKVEYDGHGMSTPEKLVCDECGSEDVTVDGTLGWDTDTQEWVVVDVGDYSWCGGCDINTRTEFVPLGDVRTAAIIAINKKKKDEKTNNSSDGNYLIKGER